VFLSGFLFPLLSAPFSGILYRKSKNGKPLPKKRKEGAKKCPKKAPENLPFGEAEKSRKNQYLYVP